MILPAIACNLDADILAAALPLFEEERVAAVEWSFDSLFEVETVPPWFEELLSLYSGNQRLIGHGVFFSLFSGNWVSAQQEWLENLRSLSRNYHFDHVTEHFGFMTGRDFHSGAPLSIPFNETTLRIGRDRLSRIADAARCPVGLENLAFAYSLEDVWRHGEFLDRLITPINGFLIFDLHNLYCHSHNFSRDVGELMQSYPLEKVREIHISGGSWDDLPSPHKRRIRRDTHDECVPLAVFELLEMAIDCCPNLKYVVLEQLGTGLKTEESRAGFFDDYLRLQQLLERKNVSRCGEICETFRPKIIAIDVKVITDANLHRQQLQLSDMLESSRNLDELLLRLQHSSLAGSDWKIEDWDPDMLETAMKIAKKWAKQG